MFKYAISLGRVHDRIIVREQNESLTLRVDADPHDLVKIMKRTEYDLRSLRKSEDIKKEAETISKKMCLTIFGEDQTQKLFDLYNGDGLCVLNVCSKYFTDRLGRLITKAQRRARI